MNESLKHEVRAFRNEECPARDLDAFRELVVEGNQVNPNTLPGLMEQAKFFGLAYVAGNVVGVGAIKRPFATYRKKVFASAGLSDIAADFQLELGWIYVRPALRNRGLANALIAKLMSAIPGEAIYATTKEDNLPMHAALGNFGFKPNGSTYQSNRDRSTLCLLLRMRTL